MIRKRPKLRPPVVNRRRFCATACAAAFLGLAGIGAPRPIEASNAGLFGYRERESRAIKPFLKWRGTLDRYFAERKLEDAPCNSGLFNRCHLRDWKSFLADINGRDRMTQIEEVNAYMNRAPYILDPINYGVPDYWATPKQFLVKDGDCEDYAIAKYLSLRALGFPVRSMRIVVLQDENLRLAHAVLAVYHDGDIHILDNQIRRVVTHRRIRHYRPIYSINEEAWWLHVPARG